MKKCFDIIMSVAYILTPFLYSAVVFIYAYQEDITLTILCAIIAVVWATLSFSYMAILYDIPERQKDEEKKK